MCADYCKVILPQKVGAMSLPTSSFPYTTMVNKGKPFLESVQNPGFPFISNLVLDFLSASHLLDACNLDPRR
jgi:hypothetical protein